MSEFHLWVHNTRVLFRALIFIMPNISTWQNIGSMLNYSSSGKNKFLPNMACVKHTNLFTVAKFRNQPKYPLPYTWVEYTFMYVSQGYHPMGVSLPFPLTNPVHEGPELAEVRWYRAFWLIPCINYERFNYSNFSICFWSWNYRGCWHQTCPPIVTLIEVWTRTIPNL